MAENYEHIKKYKRLAKKTKKIMDTTDLHHTGAYTHAADEILEGDDKLIDYDLLKQSKYQKKFAEKMSDFYIDKAEKTYKIKLKERDEPEKAMLMKAYSGTTKAQLMEFIRDERNNFTLETFERKYKSRFMREIAESLSGVAGQHLKDEHIGDIIKYTKVGHLVNPDYMRLEDALELLNIHIVKGTVPEDDLEGKIYYKKKEKSEEEK